MRVVVTGLGAITPLGSTVPSTWDGLVTGRSAARALTEPWAVSLPVRIAAQAEDPALLLGRVEARRLDRAGQFSLVAAREAWADAGFSSLDGSRVGVVLGSGMGGLSTLLQSHSLLGAGESRQISPFAVPMGMLNSAAARIALEVNALAGVHAPGTACAAGGEAVASGLDMIRLGRADVVVVGGVDAVVHPLAIHAFAKMGAMSRCNETPACASRPFDKKRDGFVLGEGAAVLVLESERHAVARGARIYCVLSGAGVASEAFHMVRPREDGDGMGRALRNALADSGLTASDVAHVSAHASSTPQGDLAESRALCGVLGVGGYGVSAIKSSAGHLMGASGALSAVASVLSLRDRVVPPTVNVEDLDDAVELDVVREVRSLPSGDVSVLSCSAGFGGQNVVLAFQSC